MQTYPTIQQAFANGKGDCFFTKAGQFIAVNRNNLQAQTELLNAGFSFMSYDSVIKQSLQSTSVTAAVIWLNAHNNKAMQPAKPKRMQPFSHPDIYEFTDADPGL